MSERRPLSGKSFRPSSASPYVLIGFTKTKSSHHPVHPSSARTPCTFPLIFGMCLDSLSPFEAFCWIPRNWEDSVSVVFLSSSGDYATLCASNKMVWWVQFYAVVHFAWMTKSLAFMSDDVDSFIEWVCLFHSCLFLRICISLSLFEIWFRFFSAVVFLLINFFFWAMKEVDWLCRPATCVLRSSIALGLISGFFFVSVKAYAS